MKKQPLLFLCHRIPYPPDKGDKIRSYNFLLGLARKYRVFLGSFVDSDKDWMFVPDLEHLCEDVFLLKLGSRKKILRSAISLMHGSSITTSCYNDRKMHDWAYRTVRAHCISRIFAFSGGVGSIALQNMMNDSNVTIDFIDFDSEKWKQYSTNRYWPLSMIFRREARLLFEEEKNLCRNSFHSVFVSREEAIMFKKKVPELSDRVGNIRNGVDTSYFSPDLVLNNPYENNSKTIVFTGVMSYWPNVEAVISFNNNVMPLLLAKDSNWKFFIVGGEPSKSVRALDNNETTRVVGRVKDMRPWLFHATLAVAPMLVGRGIQNKVLEALAMETSVVASKEALIGVGASDIDAISIAETPKEYVSAITRIETTKNKRAAEQEARQYVVENFSWDHSLSQLFNLIEASCNDGTQS